MGKKPIYNKQISSDLLKFPTRVLDAQKYAQKAAKQLKKNVKSIKYTATIKYRQSKPYKYTVESAANIATILTQIERLCAQNTLAQL